MSVAFLGDIHSGLKNDDEWYHENLYTVIKQCVDHCKANGITTIVQSGDFFDVRKATTQTTMNFVRERLVPLLLDMEVIVLVGNHDCQYKDKIQPNAPREVLSKYPCFTVIDEPTTMKIAGVDFDLIPWIADSNAESIFDFIAKSKSRFCMGHFELAGYYFYKNSKADHGLESDFLRKYDRVFSGHYHHANDGGNVHYIGTPLTMTANDEDEVRGFYEFNGTEDLKFIPNPAIHHRKILYPLNADIDVNQFKNCAVRLFIDAIDDNLSKFQTAIEKVAHTVDIKNNLKNDSDISDDFEIETVQALFDTYIDGMNHSDEDKAEIKRYVSSLYNEASSQ